MPSSIQSVYGNLPITNDASIKGTNKSENKDSFAAFFKNALNEVNNAQVQSDIMTNKLINGEKVDLHNVMIASEKASILLQTTIEMRNKGVEAYQEIMRMNM